LSNTILKQVNRYFSAQVYTTKAKLACILWCCV